MAKKKTSTAESSPINDPFFADQQRRLNNARRPVPQGDAPF